MFFEIVVNFLSVMMTRLTCALLLIGAGLLPLAAQAPGTATGPLLFEGARLIVGDGRPPVENSAFLVEGSRITQVGTRGSLKRPAGSTVVDLQGKTVMPALIELHAHLGYFKTNTERRPRATSFTRDQLLNDLQQLAYYGVGSVLSLGADRRERIGNERQGAAKEDTD